MIYATISADVISYSSLPEKERRSLESGITGLLNDLTKKYNEHDFFGRLIQGDYIECAIKSPRYALRIALLIKTFVKSFDLDSRKLKGRRYKYFSDHGIRLAIAIAPLDKFEPDNGIIDGEAIYHSGRAIKSLSTSEKKKVVIKNTMYLYIHDKSLEDQFDTVISLLDTLLSKCSARQSEIIYYKLLDYTEKDISRKLKRSQSTVSQHSTASGWISIEKAVSYFEKSI